MPRRDEGGLAVTMIEKIMAKRDAGESLTAFDLGYLSGWGDAKLDSIAKFVEITDGEKEGEE